MNIKLLSEKKSIAGLTIAVAFLFIGAAWFFRSSAETSVPADAIVRPVKTLILAKTASTETRSFPGLVKAARETRLAFRVSGPLVAFDVRIGEQVKAGDVLARIDPRDFEINVMRLSAALGEARAGLKAMKSGARAEDIARLEAELTAARARLTNAQKDFRRQQNLLAEQAVSQVQFDNSQTALDAAGAGVEVLVQQLKAARKGARAEDVEAAEAGIRRLTADLRAAKNALEDTRLRAPFDGVVSHKFVENFENIGAGAPIVSFLDLSSVEVETSVPEELLIRRTAISDIACTMEAYRGKRFPAVIKEIGRKTETANQSYPLTVILRLPENLVAEPGMAATLHIALGEGKDSSSGFSLPLGAVFADPQGHSCVWRVDEVSLQVVRTPVSTGMVSNDLIFIDKGLSAGDRIVTAGARFLRDGQKVRLLEKKQEETRS